MQKTILLAMLLTINYSIAQKTWNFESFETEKISKDILNRTKKTFGIWIDGGSYAYRKERTNPLLRLAPNRITAFSHHGAHGFVLERRGDAEKHNYSSLYSETLDLKGVQKVNISFKYLGRQNSGTLPQFFNPTAPGSPIPLPAGKGGVTRLSPPGRIQIEAGKDALDAITKMQHHFYLEASKDGGQTYELIKSWRIDDKSNWRRDPVRICATAKDALGAITTIAAAACAAGVINNPDGSGLFRTASVDIDPRYMGQNTVFRIRTIFPDPLARLTIDNLEIKYYGTTAPKVNNIQPQNTYAPSPKALLGNENATFENPQGPIFAKYWLDGGGDAYVSTLHPSLKNNKYAVIRDYYDYKFLENPNDRFSGEKPDYSSIRTPNLDLTSIKDVELNFDFISVGLEMSPEPHIKKFIDPITKTGTPDGTPDSFALYVSTKAGLERTQQNGLLDGNTQEQKYSLVKRWTVGKDFLNERKYNTSVSISPKDFPDFNRFTTTTVFKLVAETDDETDRVFIDNLKIYTSGNSGFSKGAPVNIDFAKQQQTTLTSDGSITRNVWQLVNRAFNTGKPEYVSDKPGIYGAVEHSDCSLTGGRESYTEEFDNTLNKNVFSFNIYKVGSTDRCKKNPYKPTPAPLPSGIVERQRVEIKAYSQSPEFQKAKLGNTHLYSWKFKLASDFQASDRFTHLHQLKSVGGTQSNMPLITLSAGGKKVDEMGKTTAEAEMRLRYSPDGKSQITLKTAPLSKFKGRWVEAFEKVHYNEWFKAVYEIVIRDVVTGEEIFNFESYSLRMWKSNATFVRPKWGIYRSMVEHQKLKDEQVKYTDFIILSSNTPRTSLKTFATYTKTKFKKKDDLNINTASIYTQDKESTVVGKVSLNGVVDPENDKLFKIWPTMQFFDVRDIVILKIKRPGLPFLIASKVPLTNGNYDPKWKLFGRSVTYKGEIYIMYQYTPIAKDDLIVHLPKGSLPLAPGFDPRPYENQTK